MNKITEISDEAAAFLCRFFSQENSNPWTPESSEILTAAHL
jgi:hypothetical protein